MTDTDKMLEAFRSMNSLELADFIKRYEETFGVSASIQMPPPPEPPVTVVDIEEQDEFDVIIEAAGDRKIQVIKEVRSLTTLGLKDSKDLVDSLPATLLKAVTKEAAERAVTRLQAVGATAKMQ